MLLPKRGETPGGLRGRFVHLQLLQPFGIRLSYHQLGESCSIHTTLLGREVRHNSLWKKHIYIYICIYVCQMGKKTLPGQRGWKSPVIDEFRMFFFCWAFFCFNEHHWLVVSTNPLEKYSSNWESFPPKWVWNHHVDITSKVPLMMLSWDCTSSRLQPPLLWEDFAAKCLWQPCCAE